MTVSCGIALSPGHAGQYAGFDQTVELLRGSGGALDRVDVLFRDLIDKMPGFVEFHLLKGPEHEDFTLYSSHTVWQSKAAFEAWTRSEEFRAAHKDAGQNKPPPAGGTSRSSSLPRSIPTPKTARD